MRANSGAVHHCHKHMPSRTDIQRPQRRAEVIESTDAIKPHPVAFVKESSNTRQKKKKCLEAGGLLCSGSDTSRTFDR